MKVHNLEINKIKENPNNPRKIDDNSLKRLKQSIKDFPQMLDIRPLVVDNNNVVLGGNMRLKALKDLGYTNINVVYVDNLTEEQKKEFIIKDNLSYGEWDWNILNVEWNIQELSEWGMEIVNFIEEDLSYEDLVDTEKTKSPKITITLRTLEDLQEAEIDVRELLDRKFPTAFFSISGGDV